MQGKFRAHILKGSQNTFMEKFNCTQYYTNMDRVGKKSKQLSFMYNIVEQYDFYIKNCLL